MITEYITNIKYLDNFKLIIGYKNIYIYIFRGKDVIDISKVLQALSLYRDLKDLRLNFK